MADWVGWHTAYESDTPLARRLVAVQEQVALALTRAAPGPVRLLSLCAGEGRDVLPVLTRLCARAAVSAPPGLAVVAGDAGTTAACVGAAPADLLLLCGIFGNVSDDDVRRTVEAVPALLAAGGNVIWTRHTGAPDLTPQLRAWCAAAGVTETAFVTGDRWSVGAGVRHAAPEELPADERLFTFVG
jgi:hypothetical protein